MGARLWYTSTSGERSLVVVHSRDPGNEFPTYLVAPPNSHQQFRVDGILLEKTPSSHLPQPNGTSLPCSFGRGSFVWYLCKKDGKKHPAKVTKIDSNRNDCQIDLLDSPRSIGTFIESISLMDDECQQFIRHTSCNDLLVAKSNNTLFSLARGSAAMYKTPQGPFIGAVVNAANEECIRGSGIDAAINDLGGKDFVAAREALPVIDAYTNMRCRVGSAVATRGMGQLQVQIVVHAVAPRYSEKPDVTAVMNEKGYTEEAMARSGWTPAQKAQLEDKIRPEIERQFQDDCKSKNYLLRSAYMSSLGICRQNRVTHVRFCLLAAGVFRGSQSLLVIVETAIKAITDWIAQNADTSLQDISLSAYTDEEAAALVTEARYWMEQQSANKLATANPRIEQPTSAFEAPREQNGTPFNNVSSRGRDGPIHWNKFGRGHPGTPSFRQGINVPLRGENNPLHSHQTQSPLLPMGPNGSKSRLSEHGTTQQPMMPPGASAISAAVAELQQMRLTPAQQQQTAANTSFSSNPTSSVDGCHAMGGYTSIPMQQPQSAVQPPMFTSPIAPLIAGAIPSQSAQGGFQFPMQQQPQPAVQPPMFSSPVAPSTAGTYPSQSAQGGFRFPPPQQQHSQSAQRNANTSICEANSKKTFDKGALVWYTAAERKRIASVASLDFETLTYGIKFPGGDTLPDVPHAHLMPSNQIECDFIAGKVPIQVYNVTIGNSSSVNFIITPESIDRFMVSSHGKRVIVRQANDVVPSNGFTLSIQDSGVGILSIDVVGLQYPADGQAKEQERDQLDQMLSTCFGSAFYQAQHYRATDIGLAFLKPRDAKSRGGRSLSLIADFSIQKITSLMDGLANSATEIKNITMYTPDLDVAGCLLEACVNFNERHATSAAAASLLSVPPSPSYQGESVPSRGGIYFPQNGQNRPQSARETSVISHTGLATISEDSAFSGAAIAQQQQSVPAPRKEVRKSSSDDMSIVTNIDKSEKIALGNALRQIQWSSDPPSVSNIRQEVEALLNCKVLKVASTSKLLSVMTAMHIGNYSDHPSHSENKHKRLQFTLNPADPLVSSERIAKKERLRLLRKRIAEALEDEN
jgi:O-acetyl-ADP-ribose deacetylase (regulator of RNase III)